MQNQHLPVLIFAQSGRFLAQSATQAGHTVWVADCFGDIDTLAVCERWQCIPAFAEISKNEFIAILEQITLGQNCILVCGSGIEQCPHLLTDLPNNIHYCGNTVDAITTVKTPSVFFKLLDKLNIAYPQITFDKPTDNGSWLVKSSKGMGGQHIQNADNAIAVTKNTYFQRYIEGTSGSALFLASKQSANLLSINQQFIDRCIKSPFRLGCIDTPLLLPENVRGTLLSIIEQITQQTQLIGLNSLDFIVTPDNQLLVLEINPRPSASMELVTTVTPIIQLHIDACSGNTEFHLGPTSSSHRSLCYFYADRNYVIPTGMQWPLTCSDRAHYGQLIKAGEPICTSLVESECDNIEQLHLNNKNKIWAQLTLTT